MQLEVLEFGNVHNQKYYIGSIKVKDLLNIVENVQFDNESSLYMAYLTTSNFNIEYIYSKKKTFLNLEKISEIKLHYSISFLNENMEIPIIISSFDFNADSLPF